MSETSHLPLTRSRIANHRTGLALAALALLAVTCTCGQFLPEGVPPVLPSEEVPASQPPVSPTESLVEVPTEDPQAALWAEVAGMWSGCPADTGGGLFLDICTLTDDGYPLGPFVTLFLEPVCDIGQVCGLYIKGAFDSEFIPFDITLEGFDGDNVLLFADPGSGMFSGLELSISIHREGDQLISEESNGETLHLSQGCNPIIEDAFPCMETMP